MRISCPNCGAQYEVPDEVIPQDGRDVQCSNCGMTWFQAHPDHIAAESEDISEPPVADAYSEPEPETEFAEAEIEAEEAMAEPARRELSPDVSDILRQEAEHEAELRAADTGLESQPDLGLDNLPGDAAQSAGDTAQSFSGSPAMDDVQGSRRDLLPDIDELNSSLQSDKDSTALTPHLAEETEPKPVSKSGFSRGFAFTMVLAALVVVVYANAPEISERVPQADPFLNALVTFIDKGRVWLDAQVKAFVG